MLSVIFQRHVGDGVMLAKPEPAALAPRPRSASLVSEQRSILVLVQPRPHLHQVCRANYAVTFMLLKALPAQATQTPALGRFAPCIFHFISCYLLWNKGGSTPESTHKHARKTFTPAVQSPPHVPTERGRCSVRWRHDGAHVCGSCAGHSREI